ncbi:hypothetical protein ACU6ZR_12415 [Klebsiella aerogenes]
MPQKENSNRENAMTATNLKIEYVDGQLVALEKNGTSFLDTGVTALYFSHTLKEMPLLKVEMGGGPVKDVPAPPPQQEQAEPTVPVSTESPKEGELLPPAQQPQPRGRRRRNRQRSQ